MATDRKQNSTANLTVAAGWPAPEGMRAPRVLGEREFFEAMRRETSRAVRHGRSLCLVLLEISRESRDRLSDPRLLKSIRAEDVAGKLSQNLLGFLLPETSGQGGESFVRRLSAASPEQGTAGCFAGVAEFSPWMSVADLFRQASDALRLAREKSGSPIVRLG